MALIEGKSNQSVDYEGGPSLSICIATYNRGEFIGETLDSILMQLVPGVEVIVVDGASLDNTSKVMQEYVSRNPEVRYHREDKNLGIDRDYDKAVHYARGDYCWLMTDDDLLRPGAVKALLSAIDGQHDLIIVNAEVRNRDLSELLEERRLDLKVDREYVRNDLDEFFSDTAGYLSFIGGVVIRRICWLGRDRSPYYGSEFVHMGVVFQHPPIERIRVIADPLVVIRYGNAMWTSRGFEIWMFKWPKLIWSFPDFSEVSKQKICLREPWRSSIALFRQRAIGGYSLAELHRYMDANVGGLVRAMAYVIGVFPASLANFLAVFYFSLFKRSSRITLYDLLRSRHASAASRVLARTLGP